MSPQSNYVRLIVPVIVTEVPRSKLRIFWFFFAVAVFYFLCCSFWKRLNQFLALLSTLRMLSLERQNECAFILLLSTLRMLSLERQNECAFILLSEHDRTKSFGSSRVIEQVRGGRIFFSRVDFLCWLLFRYPFHPRVTTVARKKSRSFCQKCRWQVTAKHAYTLRMWILLNRASALVTTCP